MNPALHKRVEKYRHAVVKELARIGMTSVAWLREHQEHGDLVNLAGDIYDRIRKDAIGLLGQAHGRSFKLARPVVAVRRGLLNWMKLVDGECPVSTTVLCGQMIAVKRKTVNGLEVHVAEFPNDTGFVRYLFRAGDDDVILLPEKEPPMATREIALVPKPFGLIVWPPLLGLQVEIAKAVRKEIADEHRVAD